MREEYRVILKRREKRKERYNSKGLVGKTEYYISKTVLALSVPTAIAGLGYMQYYENASAESFLVATAATLVGIGGSIWGASTRLEEKV